MSNKKQHTYQTTLRMSEDDKALFKAAAEADNMDLSTWLVLNARPAAKKTLQERLRLKLLVRAAQAEPDALHAMTGDAVLIQSVTGDGVA